MPNRNHRTAQAGGARNPSNATICGCSLYSISRKTSSPAIGVRPCVAIISKARKES
jgi:hypothetical protein